MRNLQVGLSADYDMFKVIVGNRPIDQLHVQTLVESIKRKDLTSYVPILVNDRYEIIDGQHRFYALKQLQKPVNYLIVGDLPIEDIISLNSVARQWKLTDYLESFIALGNPNYIEFKKYLSEFKMPISTGIQICSKTKGTRYGLSKKFKRGVYETNNLEMAYAFGDFLRATGVYYEKFLDRAYVRALWIAYKTEDFNSAFMLEQMEKQQVRIVPCVSTRDYLVLLEGIYNYRLKKGIRLY